jgi:hypothetical protein
MHGEDEGTPSLAATTRAKGKLPMPRRDVDPDGRLSDELVDYLASGHDVEVGYDTYLRCAAREIQAARSAARPSTIACTEAVADPTPTPPPASVDWMDRRGAPSEDAMRDVVTIHVTGYPSKIVYLSYGDERPRSNDPEDEPMVPRESHGSRDELLARKTRIIADMRGLKHGPGGSGLKGPCSSGCAKCLLEVELRDVRRTLDATTQPVEPGASEHEALRTFYDSIVKLSEHITRGQYTHGQQMICLAEALAAVARTSPPKAT